MPAQKPLIGVTLDAEPGAPGAFSRFPYYALRQHYLDAITHAGGIPVALGHHPNHAEALMARLDGLVITGGAFDLDPALYGEEPHPQTTPKPQRTTAERALLRAALARDLPILGICGGMQLLAVAFGGTLIQHIPDTHPNALPHEQPNPRDEPGHTIAITPGTHLATMTHATTMRVNSSHHQAVRTPGTLRISAHAPDGIIEAVEHPKHPFRLGVQWHPEFLIDPADRNIFASLVETARSTA